MMNLISFRVINFRSVDDSGWINISSITALIGTNESGKTNLLLPLWKFCPAKDGEINPLADYPRSKYNSIRQENPKPVFIETKFDLPDRLAHEISNLTGVISSEVKTAVVKRRFSGEYEVVFPDAKPKRYVLKTEVLEIFSETQDSMSQLVLAGKSEDVLQSDIQNFLEESIKSCTDTEGDGIGEEILKKIKSISSKINLENSFKRSTIVPRFGQLIDSIDDMISSITKPHPDESDLAIDLVLDNLPKFVYYSNYGNLDSEIYLPHVIDNMRRSGLGSRAEAQARTLKVLFDFVNLNPKEILELGQDIPATDESPDEEQIKKIRENKKEREILLQSAGTKLTKCFRDWWKQGEYRFRFQADGDHFRIWVSDEKRPDEIELEGRSTGLQWFLSFYLIFLVESNDSHQGSILLLDEPGVTLHPIAQRDLSDFFSSLSSTNQLIYTTHSPFLVNPDHLDRVKAVYVNNNGATEISSNLRAGEKNSSQTKSIYPVHAALGLTVSETLLQGCQTIVVEGTSDQHYLSAIKNYLIGKKMINPKREMIFVPSGGVKGVNPIVSLLTGKDETLPYVILDSDKSGEDMSKILVGNLYRGTKDRVVMIGNIRSIQNSEIEDLIPSEILIKIIDKLYFRDVENGFDDEFKSGEPIVSQIEEYSQKYSVKLPHGWKVDVAIRTKERLLAANDPMRGESEYLVEIWKKLFDAIQS